MRHATIVGIFTAMLTLLPGLVFAEHVIDDSKNTSYLFVISGTSGSLDGDTSTLNGVPNVVYFSDRPVRIAGHLSVPEFIKMWSKGSGSFKADPPNAVLSVFKKEGAENIVAELKGVQQKNGSIVFKVDTLAGRKAIESFGIAAVYIDAQHADLYDVWQ